MKKLLAMILIVILAMPAAYADVDLSGMSFEELVDLREQLNLAIWNSQEWQEVTVPIGVWKIGEDIPVGKWTISVSHEFSDDWGEVFYCSSLDQTGLKADWNSSTFYYGQLDGEENNDLRKTIDIDCAEGMYLVIDRTSMVFRPYAGKPDLGFH